METQAYCVTFNFNRVDNGEYFLTSEIIPAAKSEAEALGEALKSYGGLDNLRLVEWYIKSFARVDNDRNANDEMKLRSFLELVEFSGPAIMTDAVQMIEGSRKISAIKYIRGFLKPYLSLMDCKTIISLWEEQNTYSPLSFVSKTPLITLVNEMLNEK